jgi:hypothetical protein
MIHQKTVGSAAGMVLNQRKSGTSRRLRIFAGGAQKAAKEAAERLKQHVKIDPRRILTQKSMHTLMKEALRDKSEKSETPESTSHCY